MSTAKLQKVQGKGLLQSAMDQMPEDESTKLAKALADALWGGDVERTGYREAARAKAPALLEKFEQAEAGQKRFDAIQKMDPASISALPSDERTYMQTLRELPSNAGPSAIMQADATAVERMRMSSDSTRAGIVAKHSPMAPLSRPDYASLTVSGASQRMQQPDTGVKPTAPRQGKMAP
jgi:hypothetical protein